jgi:hypothetical protein
VRKPRFRTTLAEMGFDLFANDCELAGAGSSEATDAERVEGFFRFATFQTVRSGIARSVDGNSPNGDTEVCFQLSKVRGSLVGELCHRSRIERSYITRTSGRNRGIAFGNAKRDQASCVPNTN